MGGFQMNPNWEKELLQEIAPALNEIGGTLQSALDKVSTEFAGRPIEEVKVALASAWSKATPGGSITDPQLTAAADAISRGGRLRLENGRLIADGLDDE